MWLVSYVTCVDVIARVSLTQLLIFLFLDMSTLKLRIIVIIIFPTDRHDKIILTAWTTKKLSYLRLIGGCSHMSARYYLPLWHDEVAKAVLNSHLKKFYPSKKNISLSSRPKYIYKEKSHEYWWNVSVKTVRKVPQNKPNSMIWDQEVKIFSVIEFNCLLDININKKVNGKLENYGPLICNLQIMYTEYKFQVALVANGAMGYAPKCLIY